MIRVASREDADRICAIYAPVVLESVVSLEWEAPDAAEMSARIEDTLHRFPWLVYVEDDRVLGYAYASSHRSRVSYQWSTEVSVYVLPEAQRRGVGSALYDRLFALLRFQGYVNALAVIGHSNPDSVRFHEGLGFEPVGVFRSAGYKSGAWRDVLWMRKELVSPPTEPEPPVAFSELDVSQVQEVLRFP